MCGHVDTCVTEQFMHDILGRHAFKIPFIRNNKEDFRNANRHT